MDLKLKSGRMVVSDLDGTMLRHGGEFSESLLDLLRQLETLGITRVVATGRSLWVARKALHTDFPVDYLIFSSGIGVFDWKEQRLLLDRRLREDEITLVTTELRRRQLDFMVHGPVPDNHFFHFYQSANPASDFLRRLEKYRAFAQPLIDGGPAQASQFIAICDGKDEIVFDQLKECFCGFSVIRTTSPLDGKSLWVEILPNDASKSQAAQWLTSQLNMRASEALAVGNDYNDLDLLQWAGTAYVVANAPEGLKEAFTTVPSEEQDGFCEAVARWL